MTDTPPIIVAGSALWDIIATASRPMKPGFDVPGRIQRQLGGVALNIALAVARHDRGVVLLSAIGRDKDGEALIQAARQAGIDCSQVTRIDDPTDTYLAVENPDGEVFSAIADCASLEAAGDTILAPLGNGGLGKPDHPCKATLIIDGNLPEDLLNRLPTDPMLARAQLAFVPASPGKAGRLKGALRSRRAIIYVNLIEAGILAGERFDDAGQAATALVELGALMAVVTDGPRAAASAEAGVLYQVTPPAVPTITTTGAGDVFLAHHIVAISNGMDHQQALSAAVAAAARHISGMGRAP